MIEISLFLIITVITIRILFLMVFKSKYKCLKNAKTLIVIGSGGHTLEMIKSIKTLNPRLFEPRVYVMADVDTSSEHKIFELEKELQNQSKTEYEIVKIPRSRSVNQSYFSSIFTTVYSILLSIPVVIKFKPDLILCNGPGTCIPVCGKMPLTGIKVLELAGLAPVPFCGAVLADFGASVIRIDKVLSLDLDCLRNGKKSLALNLKDKRGQNILKKLSSEADVLIEPFRKGVMEKLGLGPTELMEQNPRLIYARLTGFGQTGPYSSMAGHDINFLSLSGLLSFLGRKNEKPTFPVNLLADFGGGGLTCALGIVLALLERTQSGKGQVIDCSMVEGTAYLGSWVFRCQNLSIWSTERGTNVLDTGSHCYDTYETSDGKYMAVGALESRFYDIMTEKLQAEELKDQWSDIEYKKQVLTRIFKTKTRDEWSKIFEDTDCCVTPVLDKTDVDRHPQNKERETFIRLDKNVVAPKPAPRLSRTPGKSKATEPLLKNGTHTEEILLDLGYTKPQIEELQAEGVIETATLSSQSKL